MPLSSVAIIWPTPVPKRGCCSDQVGGKIRLWSSHVSCVVPPLCGVDPRPPRPRVSEGFWSERSWVRSGVRSWSSRASASAAFRITGMLALCKHLVHPEASLKVGFLCIFGVWQSWVPVRSGWLNPRWWVRTAARRAESRLSPGMLGFGPAPSLRP